MPKTLKGVAHHLLNYFLLKIWVYLANTINVYTIHPNSLTTSPNMKFFAFVIK